MEISSRKHEKARRKENAGLDPNILNNLLQTSKLSTEPKIHRTYTEPVALSNGSDDKSMEAVAPMPRPMLHRHSSSKEREGPLPRTLPPLNHTPRSTNASPPRAQSRRHSSAGGVSGAALKRASSTPQGGALPETRASRPMNPAATSAALHNPRGAPPAVQQHSTTRSGLNLLDEATVMQGYIHRQVFDGPVVIPQGRGISGDSASLPQGHLIFSSNFEGGNVAGAKRSDDGNEYEITLRPDSNNQKYRLWFNFCVTNCYQGQQVVLTITNFSKGRSLYRHGMTPVVRSARRPTWCRVPARNTFYYKAAKGSGNQGYALSWAFVFDDADDTYEFAYSFPFTYTALQYELGYLDFLDLPYCRRQLLTRSPQLRRVDLLTISQPMYGCPRDVIQGSQEQAGAEEASAATCLAGAMPVPGHASMAGPPSSSGRAEPDAADSGRASTSSPEPRLLQAKLAVRVGSSTNLAASGGPASPYGGSDGSDSESGSQASQSVAGGRGLLGPTPPAEPPRAGPGRSKRPSSATSAGFRASSTVQPAASAENSLDDLAAVMAAASVSAASRSAGGARTPAGSRPTSGSASAAAGEGLSHRPTTPGSDRGSAQPTTAAASSLLDRPELAARARTAMPASTSSSSLQHHKPHQQKASVYGVGFPAPGQAPRKVVVVTCRVHPGETPASYVLQGLVNFLLGPDPEAAAARSGLTWLIVPMLNPDGCFLGNYRCDASGVDLNRVWRAPCAPTSPSLHHTLNLLNAYASHPGFEVALFVDVHAHSTSRHSFMFCNQPSAAPPPLPLGSQLSVLQGLTTQSAIRFSEPPPLAASGALQPLGTGSSSGLSGGPLPAPPPPAGFGGFGGLAQSAMSGQPPGQLWPGLGQHSMQAHVPVLSIMALPPPQAPPRPFQPFDPQAALERVMRLPRLMDGHCAGFSLAACVFDDEPVKAGCARRVVGSLLPKAMCYTLEVSFFHAAPDVTVLTPSGADSSSSSSNTIEGYLGMGRGLGLSVAQLFGLLPAAS